MVAWGEQRMRQIAAEKGVTVKLRSGVRECLSERIDLLKNCGFSIECYLLAMERSLLEPISEPQLPKGFTIRHSGGIEDAEAYVEMYNQTFIDDWNYHPWTVEQYQHLLTDPNYQPEFDLIAISSDGTFVASCCCYISPEQNNINRCKASFISGLGTKRGFRRQGLGRAMLLSGMRKLKSEGMDIAKLFVNTDNLNRAKQLYKSVGFSEIYTNISLVKEI
jgi:ribosomal protein S18 acetylase RimI-like enzyme